MHNENKKFLTKESTNSNAIVHVLEFCMNRLSPIQCQEIDIQEESIILTYYVRINGQTHRGDLYKRN